MKKLLLLASLLLLTACVQTTITHKLERDGTVDVSVTFIGDDKVLAGFRNLAVNDDIKASLDYEDLPTNVTYLFENIDPNQRLFGSSMFSAESYKLTKKKGFPYYTYTYTVELTGSGNASDAPQGLTSAVFVVKTFGTVYNTDADRVDESTVSFVADATSGVRKEIHFRESFISAWFKG